jgi:hypothetical protein
MQVEVLKGGWIKQGSVIAFPQEWQRPAKTEEWVYETLIEKQVNSMFVEFIAFPWATLIDLIQRGKDDRAKKLISVLAELPPKKALIRATACQHINPRVIEYLLTQLKITDLFWSHKVESQDSLGVIRLHPMALYPVAYFQTVSESVKPLSERKYLYSFIGAYDQQGYISSIRESIFNLSNSSRSLIVKRDAWHFEGAVYGAQINGIELQDAEIENSKIEMKQYTDAMLDSVVSLCPSGAGPNSIRLWEALAMGSFPLILSDNLELPSHVVSKGFFKTSESSLLEAIVKIESNCFDLNCSFFESPDDFLANITQHLFSRKFILY